MTQHDDLDFLEEPEDEAPVAADRTDPEYWIAELGGGRVARSIVQDPSVSRAIRADKMGALHKVLRERFKKSRSPDERDILKAALDDRRLFTAVDSGAPPMVSVWGFGSAVHGAQEHDRRDGTYITTLFITLLFIPVWPIRQYLVARAPGGGWYFLGGVPMSPKVNLWRVLMTSAAGAALLVGAFFLWRSMTHAEVHILNGLEAEVVVAFGDETFTLGAQGHEVRELPSGTYHVVVKTADGRLLKEEDVEVAGGADLAVYNVLGAAPLFFRVVPYSPPHVPKSENEKKESYDCLAGKTWITRGDLDFPFDTPPDEIEMKEGVRVATRTHVDVVEGGFYTTLRVLAQLERMPDAAKLARRVAEAFPQDTAAAQSAYGFTVSVDGIESADPLVERMIASNPDNIPLHRLAQGHWHARGRQVETLEKYKRAHEADPGHPTHAYLYARLATFDVAVPLAERLLNRHPGHPWLRRILAWSAFQQLQFPAALTHYRTLIKLQPEERGGHLSGVVQSLVGLQKEDEALRELSTFFKAIEGGAPAGGSDGFAGGDSTELFGMYALLRGRQPKGSSFPTLKVALAPFLGEEGGETLALLALVGWARDAERVHALHRTVDESEVIAKNALLCVNLRTSPQSTARLAKLRGVEDLGMLDDLAMLTLACEWVRTGDLENAEKLLGGLQQVERGTLTIEHLKKLPEVSGLDENLPTVLRAALLYAASKRSDGAAADALLAEAKRFDILGRVTPK